ncbi:unnamed protein product [Peronospora farinosa]|uniref:RxLR effector protein n=1 Tax=Peronospora farinosa TaxID=134698 RepID=A0AAV0SRS9_9STRA|nr:unnamed protein product [Peronospora farinosa]
MRAFNILSLVLVTKLFLNGDASSTPRMRIVGDESDTQEERVSKALNNVFERLMERAGKAYDESLAEALYTIGGLKEITEKPVDWIDQMLKNEDYKWKMIAILLYHNQHPENFKS